MLEKCLIFGHSPVCLKLLIPFKSDFSKLQTLFPVNLQLLLKALLKRLFGNELQLDRAIQAFLNRLYESLETIESS